MTKVDIISGFLGAGKTTLIKKLLKEALHNEKIVLIENEFGEIGIDGGFMEDAGIEVREMNSGCICCSLVGDFSEALKKVIVEYTPERIIIEPSGVGKLSDVIKAVKSVQDETDIVINSLTTVADANKCKMYIKNFGEFFNNQIEHAQTIILSRTQCLKDEKLQDVVREVKLHNETANLITTPWDDLQVDEIISVMEKSNTLEKELMAETEVCPECGHHHHGEHHHHEHEECECGHEHHHHNHEECECGHEHHHHDHEECECGHEHHHHDHEEGCSCGCSHEHVGHHHADEVFTSWGSETPRKYSKDELESILKALSSSEKYGIILRAKGMLEAADHTWLYFDMVPEEYEIREGKPTYTGRFCVIGSNLNEEALKELFKAE